MITQPIDAETRVIMNGVPFLGLAEQDFAALYAKERIELFKSGVSKVPQGVNHSIKLLTGDQYLQIRWDFEIDTWILERWQLDGYWLQVMVLCNKFGQTPSLNPTYLSNLAKLLRANDLTRVDPDAYIRSKRAAASKVKEQNRREGDNMLLAAIDAMSSKQIQNFIDVHRAVHTGEKIVAHGADEKSLEVMHEVGKTAPPVLGRSLNPGMHPMIYERKSR